MWQMILIKCSLCIMVKYKLEAFKVWIFSYIPTLSAPLRVFISINTSRIFLMEHFTVLCEQLCGLLFSGQWNWFVILMTKHSTPVDCSCTQFWEAKDSQFDLNDWFWRTNFKNVVYWWIPQKQLIWMLKVVENIFCLRNPRDFQLEVCWVAKRCVLGSILASDWVTGARLDGCFSHPSPHFWVGFRSIRQLVV